jgi:phage terminase large subunit-like protein
VADAYDTLVGMMEAGELTEVEARLLVEQLEAEWWTRKRAAWHPYPWQVPPGRVETSGMWLMLGGRGTGKTDGCARYVTDHVHGPPCDPRLPGGHRIAIVAPTLGDAVESCVDGPSGLKAHDPRASVRGGVGGTYVKWPTGAVAKLFGAHSKDDVERLRSGGNRCLVWFEELAAMRYLQEALDHADLGLRVGRHPHAVGSTTPKPRKALKSLIEESSTLLSSGRTAEAVHLDPAVRAKYEKRYAGTRLGQQELEGKLLDDIEGALWTYDMIAGARVLAAPELLRVVVAVDPAVSVTESSDETGLVAVGLGVDRHCYVLGDRSAKVAGAQAARRAWQMWLDYGAGHLIYEDNQGKKWVADVLRQVWREMVAEGILPGGAPPLRGVTAYVAKRLRAEPVASLYELGQVHHVGILEELEDQQVTWVPESGDSPDRLDALVHGVTDLAGKVRTPAEVGVPRGSISAAGARTSRAPARATGGRSALPPGIRTRRG